MTPAPTITYGGRKLVRPKFWTPRDETYPTRGNRQREFARIWMRKPLMPWQELVLDVAGEYDPGTGRPLRPLVVVTCQRQGGKSHVCFVKKAERCFSVDGYRSWYTAQTGQDARRAFLKFDEEHVQGTPLAHFARTLRGNGNEQMQFPNTSTIRPHPPTEKSLHGTQGDDNDVDEGWAFSETEGKALMQAISPTHLTRPNAQTWVWSAGGTASSTWLAELVARGRDGDPAIAFFEWGIPDDLDLDDLDEIATYHPAYGYTVDAHSIRNLRAEISDDAEFARAAGNRWTEVVGGAIPAEQWTAARHDDEIPPEAPVGYGAARAVDGSDVTLAAASRVGDEIVVEVLDVLPAYGAAEQIRTWVDRALVAIDPTGPSAPLRDQCALAGVRLADMSATAAHSTVTALLDGLGTTGSIGFRPHESLEQAVKVAGLRTVGDGGKAWARVRAGASISSLEAATSAIWALTHAPKPARKPTIRGGKAA